MSLTAGVARTRITPWWGVELTGWGYYLERTWQTVHDDLNATALVLDDGQTPLAIISLDLMVVSEEFTHSVRSQVATATGIAPASILVSCTHTHNAPASQGLLGVGEVDPRYEEFAARQAATAAILAWNSRGTAELSIATTKLAGHTFNRTRENGPVDETLTVLNVDHTDGRPLATLVNFQAHPTVSTVLRSHAVSRDVPGEVCDLIEQARLGVTALYLQGACGDVNFLREYSTPEECNKPARFVAQAALDALKHAEPIAAETLSGTIRTARIPPRRWTREEIDHDRAEAKRRLEQHDVSGWRETIGRAMTNRPDDMVSRHGGDEWKAVAAMCRFNVEWTDRMLADIDRPEWLETEVQGLRIGNVSIVTNSSEFFSTLALDVRTRVDSKHLMISGYSNGRIGYVPDAHDVAARSYAAYQSPKYCNQFPFTDASGPALCDAMVDVLR